MQLHLPQIIYLTILGINLLATSYMHGKPKEGKHNIFSTLLGYLIGIILLHWGGFF